MGTLIKQVGANTGQGDEEAEMGTDSPQDCSTVQIWPSTEVLTKA